MLTSGLAATIASLEAEVARRHRAASQQGETSLPGAWAILEGLPISRVARRPPCLSFRARPSTRLSPVHLTVTDGASWSRDRLTVESVESVEPE